LSHQECVKIIRRDIARFLQIEDEAWLSLKSW
jgi:hypothetical protein